MGDLKALRLGEAVVPDLTALGGRLRRYAQLLGNRPLRVRLVGDDRLRYEPAARIIATCSAAGVSSVRLAQPGAIPALLGLPTGLRAGGRAMRLKCITGWPQTWLAILLLLPGGWFSRAIPRRRSAQRARAGGPGRVPGGPVGKGPNRRPRCRAARASSDLP